VENENQEGNWLTKVCVEDGLLMMFAHAYVYVYMCIQYVNFVIVFVDLL